MSRRQVPLQSLLPAPAFETDKIVRLDRRSNRNGRGLALIDGRRRGLGPEARERAVNPLDQIADLTRREPVIRDVRGDNVRGELDQLLDVP